MRKLLVIAAVSAVFLMFALPANAIGVWEGVVSTGCTTRLDDFPNQQSTNNSDNCDSDAGVAPNGGAAPIDYGAGVIQTQGGTWRGNGVGATRVAYEYNENCLGVPNNAFPPFGQAKGDFIVTGTIGSNTNARLLAGFNWTRTGLVATITFGPTNGKTTDAASGSQTVGQGLFGIDTNGDMSGVEIPAPNGTTASAVGLLHPRGGAGSHGLPYNNCPDDDGTTQWEVVTAYAVGTLVG